MKTIETFFNKKTTFDSIKNSSNEEVVYLYDSTNEYITINYQELINTQFSRGNLENTIQLQTLLFKKLNHSKAPCGGFVNFYQYSSNKKNKFILFSGVNEVSNSHYIITFHKIFKI